jgi:energy-coupling factor transport system substrate-specific component
MKTTLELIKISICASILVVGKFLFILIPNVEVVTFLLIIYTLIFGFKKGMLIAFIYVVIEIMAWGMIIGPQSYVWLLIVVFTGLLKKALKENFLSWAIFSGLIGLTFGFWCSIPYLFLFDFNYAFAYFISGLSFDAIHMVGNYIVMLILGKTVYNRLKELNQVEYNGF